MSELLAKTQIDHVLYSKKVIRDAPLLCEGRYDLPLRVFIGEIKGKALRIDRLLGYKNHVATLGLIGTGIHRHEAALKVATRKAGAFAGSPDAFDGWATRHQIKHDQLITTVLPDGSSWVIWQRDRPVHTKLIASVCGWSGGSVDFDQLLSGKPRDPALLH